MKSALKTIFNGLGYAFVANIALHAAYSLASYDPTATVTLSGFGILAAGCVGFEAYRARQSRRLNPPA